MRRSVKLLLGVLAMSAIPACTSPPAASRVRLPTSLLATNEPETIRIVESSPSVEPSVISEASSDAEQVRTIILPEETQPAFRTQPQTLLRSDSQRYETPTDRPRESASSADDWRTREISEQIREVLSTLERYDAEQARQFAVAVREAAATDRLPQVIAAWQATADFLRWSKPTLSAESVAAQSREPQLESAPPTLSPWSESKEPATVDRPDSPREREIAAKPAAATEAEPPQPPTVVNVQQTAYKTQINETIGPDGGRRIQVQRQPDVNQEFSPQPPTSAPITDPAKLAAELRTLAGRLESMDAATSAETLANQVKSRLLYAMSGDVSLATSPVDSPDPVDREYWRHLIRAQLDYFDDSASLPARSHQIAESLREAAAVIELRADLRISTPILCKRVNNFGNYEEFDEYRYPPGGHVIIYSEVEHFRSVATRKGFRTSMDATIEIFDSAGNRKHESRRPFADDYCERMRRDYFIAVPFQMPQDLKSGDYILKLTVHDKTSDKVAENQCRFSIN